MKDIIITKHAYKRIKERCGLKKKSVTKLMLDLEKDRINRLMKRIKCSLTIEIDRHKDSYETVSDHIYNQYLGNEEELREDIPREVYDKMKVLDSIVHIHCYPDTPVGFYSVYHYDLGTALSVMERLLNNET